MALKRFRIRRDSDQRIMNVIYQEDPISDDILRAFGDPADFTVLEHTLTPAQLNRYHSDKRHLKATGEVSIGELMEAIFQRRRGDDRPMNRLLAKWREIRRDHPTDEDDGTEE